MYLLAVLIHKLLRRYIQLLCLVTALNQKAEQGNFELADYVTSDEFKIRLVKLMELNTDILQHTALALGREVDADSAFQALLVGISAEVKKTAGYKSWLYRLANRLDEAYGLQSDLPTAPVDYPVETNRGYWN